MSNVAETDVPLARQDCHCAEDNCNSDRAALSLYENADMFQHETLPVATSQSHLDGVLDLARLLSLPGAQAHQRNHSSCVELHLGLIDCCMLSARSKKRGQPGSFSCNCNKGSCQCELTHGADIFCANDQVSREEVQHS